MHCPLCGHDNLEGLDRCEVCEGDLASADVESFRRRLSEGVLGDPLEELGSLNPAVVAPEDTLDKALPLMRQDRRGGVLIQAGEKVVGIFTEHDLVRRVPPDADPSSVVMASVMTPTPHCYSVHDTVAHALNGMTAWGNRHLPIVDDEERLVGFVSVRRVLRHLRDRCLGAA